jgi:hypothetical protein
MPIADLKYKRLNEKNVDMAPLHKGVYALYADKTLVFLGRTAGRTATLRSALRSHLGATGAGSGNPSATRYKRELTTQPEARLRTLLDEYKAEQGRLPRDNAK